MSYYATLAGLIEEERHHTLIRDCAQVMYDNALAGWDDQMAAEYRRQRDAAEQAIATIQADIAAMKAAHDQESAA